METKSNLLKTDKLASIPWAPTENPRWFGRLATWYRLKKLERELRHSEKFQKECEKLHCFNLAALEEQHRAGIAAKISWMERKPKEMSGEGSINGEAV